MEEGSQLKLVGYYFDKITGTLALRSPNASNSVELSFPTGLIIVKMY
jgi:hypothetical protein